MILSKPLVSIIVPFYNPGDYFDELLNSLKNQSYSNIEIVLVNDGSQDDSSKKALNFSLVHKKVILVEKENGGVASARQAGLEVCTGDYIIHADADDWLPKDAISKLVKKAVECSADIVVGGYKTVYSNKEIDVFIDEVNYDCFVKGLFDGKYHGALWNKLIRSDLCKAVHFEAGLDYMEDKLYLSRLLRGSKKNISYLNEIVYIYRQNISSLTYNLSPKSIESSVKVTNIIVNEYAGIFSDVFLNYLTDKQRVFFIFQMAKNGFCVFEKDDWKLIFNRKIIIKYRIAIFMISFRVLWPFKLFKYFKDKRLL